MFFTECERLAERHPDLAGTVQQVDVQLAQVRTDGVIRTSDLASFLGADPNQVSAVLEKLAHEKLLRVEEMVECSHCRMATFRSDYQQQMEDEGEYRCTSCDRPLTDTSIRAITAYRRGENWREVATLPWDASAKTARLAETLDDNAWYTHDHLAEVFGVGKDALRKRLDRYRQSDLGDGWKEQTERRPREPKYLYKLKAVRGIIEELVRASSERPAK
mgnify:FL=1